MIVTAVEEYTKNKYKIYLNDAFAFVLYKGDLRHFDIAPGRELTEEELNEIRGEVLTKRAKMRAMHLLESRDYTEDAMRRKLREGLYPQDVIQEAIDYVKHFHYIDDRRYAMSFIESHAQSLTGRQISEKLRMKGISQELIAECLAEHEEENGDLEEELLRKQMRSKVVRLTGRDQESKEPDTSARQKLFASFYRKGFSLSAISKVYEEVLTEILTENTT
ncbi:MAG: regulatory protein RecX [Lachnospiraceae bacterium]|nr:regulatory protein RecX [Lachnospiraceae bacterium]